MTIPAASWQKWATLFEPGDRVAYRGSADYHSGIVVEVHPRIGMIDVQVGTHTRRIPAEDLRNISRHMYFDADGNPMMGKSASHRTAKQQKSALYWAAPNRKYRATREELPFGPYKCPRCKDEEGFCITMRKTTLQRSEGKNFKIWVCPSCTFAIQDSDIINCPTE